MKHSQAPIRIRPGERPLRFSDFVRWATILTLGVTAVTLVIAVVQSNIEVWALSTALWFLSVVAIWIGTLSVGFLVMIPVEISRLGKQRTGKTEANTSPQKLLWDKWMDGPEPL
jgi:hypothetical protein